VYHIYLRNICEKDESERFAVGLTRSADLSNPKARILAHHWQ
jgi:hypothetical protein